MKKILSNIPTNIITGFLGAGKTTAIRHLLKTKPADQKWAVLVNEFGEVGIDGALLAADGIAVKEVPGGCMCCAVGLPSKVALNQLIRDHQPDRILIEPTGLAHPQQVVKQFSGPEYQTLLNMQAIVCMVDPWSICDEKFTRLPAFQSQIDLADRIILTKADVATPEQLQGFERFCQALQASRQRQGRSIDFATVENGHVDWTWLTVPHQSSKSVPAVRQHSAALNPKHITPAAHAGDAPPAAVTDLTRKENSAEFGFSCGWQFPDDWSFDETKLLSWVESLDIPRVKGVMRCTSRWLLLNRMRTTVSAEEIPSAEGSRLEMIHTESVNWDSIEQQLIQCRSRTS
ncbi:GTP-binding protein [Aestuariicella hydrocarbonica]|uniref:GTP-binding protein n=1 Tax=Pseudomaricurvus hydrocarbonicus TaxID=1470433 RepID=A0A9E5JWV3_9GAMM|nr:GTP-binding protein [Aestuariicella hydrocarbonica]NHO66385.1 GTP-binding protein [Aestuariicella hydrocarbonica]